MLSRSVAPASSARRRPRSRRRSGSRCCRRPHADESHRSTPFELLHRPNLLGEGLASSARALPSSGSTSTVLAPAPLAATAAMTPHAVAPKTATSVTRSTSSPATADRDRRRSRRAPCSAGHRALTQELGGSSRRASPSRAPVRRGTRRRRRGRTPRPRGEVVGRDALREHDPRARERPSISRACRVISAGSPCPSSGTWHL